MDSFVRAPARYLYICDTPTKTETALELATEITSQTETGLESAAATAAEAEAETQTRGRQYWSESLPIDPFNAHRFGGGRIPFGDPSLRADVVRRPSGRRCHETALCGAEHDVRGMELPWVIEHERVLAVPWSIAHE